MQATQYWTGYDLSIDWWCCKPPWLARYLLPDPLMRPGIVEIAPVLCHCSMQAALA